MLNSFNLCLLYTDPGSGALLWQLFMGAVVGCSFYGRRFLTRMARKRTPEE